MLNGSYLRLHIVAAIDFYINVLVLGVQNVVLQKLIISNYLSLFAILLLQPFGVERRYLHQAPLGLFVYNAVVRVANVEACMDELDV